MNYEDYRESLSVPFVGRGGLENNVLRSSQATGDINFLRGRMNECRFWSAYIIKLPYVYV